MPNDKHKKRVKYEVGNSYQDIVNPRWIFEVTRVGKKSHEYKWLGSIAREFPGTRFGYGTFVHKGERLHKKYKSNVQTLMGALKNA